MMQKVIKIIKPHQLVLYPHRSYF